MVYGMKTINLDFPKKLESTSQHFISYFQYLQCNIGESHEFVCFGVPHGFILGPLLPICFADDLKIATFIFSMSDW